MSEAIRNLTLTNTLMWARSTLLCQMRMAGGSVSETPLAQSALCKQLGLASGDYEALTGSLIDWGWAERVWTELFLTLEGWDQAQLLRT